MKLEDKIVLVTGSSSGIGQATAILFAQQGAKIVVNYKSNLQGAKDTLEQIKKQGSEAIHIQADVSQPNQVKALFEQTLEKFNRLDILINNAGSATNKPFLQLTKDDWLEEFNNNFFSTVLCSQQAAKIMLRNKTGKILNTASIRGISHAGRQGIIAYSAAKAAVINFTRTLAKELAPHITVNAVAPGFTETPILKMHSKEKIKQFTDSTYLKRLIKPEEIAQAFLYLATANAVTGEILLVDAGYTLE